MNELKEEIIELKSRLGTKDDLLELYRFQVAELTNLALDMFGDLMVAVSTWEREGHTIGDYRERLNSIGIGIK